MIAPEGDGASARTYVDAVLMSIDGKQTLVEAAGYEVRHEGGDAQ